MEEKVISDFRGKYAFLSNFFPCTVIYRGLSYSNSEAAFQAQKCPYEAGKQQFCTLLPNEAKKLGRRIALRKDWDKIKDDFMYDIVLAKFRQNASLQEALRSIGNAHLVEGNTWGDNYWGISPFNDLSQETSNNNHLGKILMRVRTEL